MYNLQDFMVSESAPAPPLDHCLGTQWWLLLTVARVVGMVVVPVVVVAENLMFMGKEDMNCILKHLVSLVEDFDAWNDYHWGEYLWDKFYKRTVNVVALHWDHHLAEKKKNTNFNATYNLYGFAWAFKKRDAWFVARIPFINGLVDEDRNGCEDDSVGVSKDNVVDRQHEYGYEDESVNETFLDEDGNACEDASTGVSKDNDVDRQHQLGYEDKRVNEKSVENNDQILLENGDAVLDSEGGGINKEADNVNQLSNVSIADLFAELRALRKEVALIKVHDEGIANLERLLKEKLQNDFAAEKTNPNIILNESDDIAKCSVLDVTSNHIGVDQGLGGSTDNPMSTCSRPDMHNVKVACDGMSIDKPDGMNDYSCSQRIPVTLDILIDACSYSNKHLELDVLQHDNHVDCSVPKLNQHPMAEPFMYDKSNKPKYVNVVRDDYKPPLETIFGYVKSKKMKCGIRKNYVLRSVKERNKRLAMALDSPYGQQGTTTPALPKTRSMSSIEDTIVAHEFEEEISGQPKIRSINELMTIQEFVEPDGFQRDKDFQDNLDDEEDTKSIYEYLKDLKEEYQASALLAKSKRVHPQTKTKVSLLKRMIGMKKVSSDENEGTEKALMGLTIKERISISKESASNGADIAKIIRKEPKPDKNEHENGKSTQEPGFYHPKSNRVNFGQLM
uniref:Phospholipase-like protein n=1 Tax=Tanacetum cinerariifolium TaxID=118510 RepID=A0A6L2N7S4_TANCI|nr:hypothetical protein [Tanacetum cinerariifolium]